MIQPTSGSITTQPQVFDGIWLQSIQINAPTPTANISAIIRAIPFNSESGSLAPINYGKSIVINNVVSASINSPEIAVAMNAIFGAIQGQIISKSIF